MELSTCRSTLTVAPISFTDIHNFAKIKEIEDFDEFLYLMRQLDSCYMDHQRTVNGPEKSS